MFVIFIFAIVLCDSVPRVTSLSYDGCGEHIRGNATNHWRISNGLKANIGEFPWHASIFYKSKATNHTRFICSGTLISDKWIITAASCVTSEPHSYSVKIGSIHVNYTGPTEQVYDDDVETILVPPEYDPSKGVGYDFALIKLRRIIDFKNGQKFLRPICLPSPYTDTNNCYATGWGGDGTKPFDISLPLYKVKLDIEKEYTNCTTGLPGMDKQKNYTICAKHNEDDGRGGTCNGDNGGPFQCESGPHKLYYLMGVTSWGQRDCKNKKFNFFTKVQKYCDWMKKHGVECEH